nr:GDSL-type esterase/lipase family protein [Brevibacterium permense]
MDPAPQDVTLLTGSSYFELGETSPEDLEGLDTVNVGIAETKIGDQIHYLDRLVVPFRPRALVVYAGSNDISGFPFFSNPAEEVVTLVKKYVALVHGQFPNFPIYYVAITEAPIRQGVREEIQQANQMLSDWADQTGEIAFINTASALLTPSGDIDSPLFRADQLHLNAEGYAKFAAVISDALAYAPQK